MFHEDFISIEDLGRHFNLYRLCYLLNSNNCYWLKIYLLLVKKNHCYERTEANHEIFIQFSQLGFLVV